MSSTQRLVTALRAQRVVASDPRTRRVRHGVRDQVMVMVLSATLSVALAGVLALLLETAVQIGTP